MKNLLKRIFAPVALAGAMALATTVNAGAQQAPPLPPPPDYERVSGLFADIMRISAANATTNPDMARAGLEALNGMAQAINKLSEKEDIALPLLSPGQSLSLDAVIDLFRELPSLSPQNGLSEQQMVQFGIAAIEKMLKDIDPHANYYPPAETRARAARMGGHYAGASSRLIGDIGYIRLNLFDRMASEDISRAIQEIQAKSATGIQGYVLDLRYNPGGYLDEAIEIADHFLEKGDIVSVKSARGKRTYKANPGDLARGKPIIVLIDGGSASAAEIVAGALQDNDRALILGTRSFGKGTVQTVFNLGGDHKFRITTAFYYTPSGDAIQRNGITPHIRFEPLEGGTSGKTPRKEKDLEGSYNNPGSARDLTGTFATCSPVEGTDTSSLGASVRFANGDPDWQLICAVENLTKQPHHTAVTPVPASPTQ